MKNDYLKLLKNKDFLNSETFKKIKNEVNNFIKNDWLIKK